MARSSSCLVCCKCSVCLLGSPAGLMIPQGTARKHRQRDLARQANVRDRERILLDMRRRRDDQDDLGTQDGNDQINQGPSSGSRGAPRRDGPRNQQGQEAGRMAEDERDEEADRGHNHGPSASAAHGTAPHADVRLDPFRMAEHVDGDGDGDFPAWTRLLHIIIIWLCCARGLPRSCAQMLLSFVATVVLAGQNQPLHVDTVRKRLGVEVSFHRFAVCPNLDCQDALSIGVAEERGSCQLCGTPYFKQSSLADRKVPVRFFSYSPLIPFLQHCWNRPGFEAAVNSWRRRPLNDGFRDVYDGQAWREGSINENDNVFTSHRHHLNLAISLDWFEPFTRRGTGSYSMGVLAVRIDNLPASMRHRTENIHIAAILPGPKQTSSHGLESAMAPLIEELKTLDRGVAINVSTASHPRQPSTMRARVYLALSDMPGRAKLCGFADHNQHGKWCPYCCADAQDWVRGCLAGEVAEPRDWRRHREAAYTARAVPTARDGCLREHSAAWSPLYHLPYWYSVAGTPVDVMHALHLGACKRFVYSTLVEGKLLMMERGNFPVIEAILRSAKYPRDINTIDPNFLTPRGGSPTADAWSVFARFFMPLVLASQWAVELRRDASRQFTSTNPCFAQSAQGRTRSPIPFVVSIRCRALVEMSMTLSRIVQLSQRRYLTNAALSELDAAIKQHISDIATLIDPRWLVPNHHALFHLPEHIRRFGPPPRFWFYAHERLNGLLKNTNHNNHRGGELELALHNSYLQYCAVKNTLNSLGNHPTEQAFASIMAAENLSQVLLVDAPDRPWEEVTTVGEPMPAELTMLEINEITALIGNNVSPVDLPVSWDLYVDDLSDDGMPGPHQATTFGTHISLFESILVHNSVVTRHNQRSNARSGGSHVVFRHGGQTRLGLLQHAFSHSHLLRTTGAMVMETYVSVMMYDNSEWPEDHVLGRDTTHRLGYLLFDEGQTAAAVIPLRDVLDTFISTTASYITGNNNDTVRCAARLHP
ncbi:hypothetical protein A4X13_0g458 [Tilletia indica]|uniref:Uncharacterized protein n=1 Tax=Tilletia indica TaxID=43049 RepID=A0A177TH11_9BASI|nr:hypothetical protein A4X13_0g458 [Tilletia indica]